MASGIEDRGSRIEDRGSRIEDRGSSGDDRGSRIEDRVASESLGMQLLLPPLEEVHLY